MLHASRRRIQPSAVQASRGSAFRFCEFANPHVTIFKEKRKKLKNSGRMSKTMSCMEASLKPNDSLYENLENIKT
jgi:hypothetical protein